MCISKERIDIESMLVKKVKKEIKILNNVKFCYIVYSLTLIRIVISSLAFFPLVINANGLRVFGFVIYL